MRLFFSRTVLLVISSVLAIGCVEIYLSNRDPISIVHLNLHQEFTPTSDDTIYEPIPNKTFNADGLRNEKNYSVQKPENVYRIALIGDSLAFGLGLSEKERFATLLEDSLNASFLGKQFEVLNFGVPGYSISQIVTHFEKQGIKFHPDLVLYWHWFDDAYVSDPGWASSKENILLRLLPYVFGSESKTTGIGNSVRTYLYGSQIIRHVIQYERNRTERTMITSKFPMYTRAMTADILRRYNTYISGYSRKEFSDLPCCDTYFREYADINNFVYWNYYMNEFSDLCIQEAYTCALLMTPILYPHNPGAYNWIALHSLITDIAQMYHFEVIDGAKIRGLHDSASIQLFPDDSEHPNVLGNQIIADLVKKELLNILKKNDTEGK